MSTPHSREDPEAKQAEETLSGDGGGPGAADPEYGSAHSARAIARILRDARTTLDMEIAFVSEFRGTRRYFRYLDGVVQEMGITVGGSDELDRTYCSRIVAGTIPRLIHDAQVEPSVSDLAVTESAQIGAHVSVPIVFSDGRIFGTFCCFSREPNGSLTQKDVGMLQSMAGLVTEYLEVLELAEESQREAHSRIREAIDGDFLRVVYQPIVEMTTGRVVGIEALSRFDRTPTRSPDVWFDEAWAAGLGAELELAAALSATKLLSELPDGLFMSVNFSPETTIADEFAVFLEEIASERLVIELTEHAQVRAYQPLLRALTDAQALGARIAIDDVGTGYSGLQSLLELRPHILKLDMSITRQLNSDPLRHSLASAIASFALDSGLHIVAEGIETEEEAQAIKALDISYGQGYLFAQPSAFRDLDLEQIDPRRPATRQGSSLSTRPRSRARRRER